MANRDKKQDLTVKVLCVVLAFALWLYITNTENPTITRQLKNVPVKVVNEDALISSGLILTPGQNFSVDITIEGPSNDVNSAKRTDFSMVLDLSSYIFAAGEQEVPVTVKDYPSSINIKSNSNLRVTVDIDKYVEKEVPIISRINAVPINGAYASEPILSIAASKVAGAEQYVNKVKYLLAQGSYSNLDEDFSGTLTLKAVDENYQEVTNLRNIDPATVAFTIPVRKSKFLTVNVKTKGSLPAGYELKSIEVSPNKIEVVGDEEYLSDIATIDTVPIDLSNVPENGELYVRIEVPAGVTLISESSIVLVKVNTIKMVEKTLEIPLSISDLGEDMEGNVSEANITVVVEAAEELIDSIQAESFKAVVKAEGLLAGDHDAQVSVTTILTGVKIKSFTPNVVRLTLTKK